MKTATRDRAWNEAGDMTAVDVKRVTDQMGGMNESINKFAQYAKSKGSSGPQSDGSAEGVSLEGATKIPADMAEAAATLLSQYGTGTSFLCRQPGTNHTVFFAADEPRAPRIRWADVFFPAVALTIIVVLVYADVSGWHWRLQ
jgi:hypothetical protein